MPKRFFGTYLVSSLQISWSFTHGSLFSGRQARTQVVQQLMENVGCGVLFAVSGTVSSWWLLHLICDLCVFAETFFLMIEWLKFLVAFCYKLDQRSYLTFSFNF
ncbi:MAG: hypothetical protein Q7J77_03035 [Undibacterium sp.]|nr:hypothetical protein [Undibacterium sp.]